MKIYSIKHMFLCGSNSYILTTNDGRIIATSPYETTYHESIAELLKTSRALKNIVTLETISSYTAVECEMVAEFTSLWKVEEEYPEILI